MTKRSDRRDRWRLPKRPARGSDLLPLLPREHAKATEIDSSLPRANNPRLSCYYLRCPARLFRSATLMRRHCERCGRVFASVDT